MEKLERVYLKSAWLITCQPISYPTGMVLDEGDLKTLADSRPGHLNAASAALHVTLEDADSGAAKGVIHNFATRKPMV